MTEPFAPPPSRLQLVKEQANKGLAAAGIQRTRLVVSIDKLIEDPENERKTFADMDGLVASVRSQGLIEPLTVSALGDDRFQIITGHRRFRAAKIVGLQQIEVLIRAAEEPQTRRIKSLISNIQRESVPPLELAQSLRALIGKEGLSQDEVGERLGRPKTWVSAVLRILDLPIDAQKKVGTSQLPLSMDSLTRIARLENQEAKVRLIDKLVDGASNESVRQEIKAIQKGGGIKKVSAPKPKRVFHTEQKADVIVQAKTSRLTHDQMIEALHEALKQASSGTPQT